MANTTNIGLIIIDPEENPSYLDMNTNYGKLDAAFGAQDLFFSVSNLSALPHTISDSKITANHRVVNAVLSNTLAQPSDWSYTTSAGSIVISGTISGTTNLYLHLAKYY